MKEWSPNPAGTSKEMLAGLTLRKEMEKNAPKILWCFSMRMWKGKPCGNRGDEQVAIPLMTTA